MSRTVLLSLHIAAAAAWLGANLVQLVVTPRLVRRGGEVAAAWADATHLLVRTYYNVAGGVLGVTGVLLVLDGGWSWSAGFVLLGLTTLVVGGLLGVVHFAPAARRTADAARAGDGPLLTRLAARTSSVAVADTALVALTLVAMVDKWAA